MPNATHHPSNKTEAARGGGALWAAADGDAAPLLELAPRGLPRTLIVMGVCGCGKSLIGEGIAAAVGGVFEDADHFHTEAAKAKMGAGVPLSDEDRWPWFDRLIARIAEMRSQTPCYVLACSALKRSYRERLRASEDGEALAFVYLAGSMELIKSRMALRVGHYMPLSLLESQFATLEVPSASEALHVSIEGEPARVVAKVLELVQ